MKKSFVYPLLLLLLLALLTPPGAFSQAGLQGIVMRTTSDAGEENLTLSVLFTVTDSSGQALSRDALQFQGERQIYGSTFAATEAEVTPATTPIRIALVIDASGSMGAEMKDVKDAAINFINQAPDNAEIAVYRFAAEITQVRPFGRKDQAQIGHVDAIRAITPESVGTGNTCIYRAAFKAVEDVNQGIDPSQGARPAVVLFTDGKDDESEQLTCAGEIKEDQVVQQAHIKGRIPTQVHTIGLCDGSPNCDNINRFALESLAKRTSARFRSDTVTEVNRLFEDILLALNNQWLAKADIRPKKGENQSATFDLEVQINGSREKVQVSTTFSSPRDYTVGSAGVIISDPIHEPGTTEYTVQVTAVNPQQLKQLTMILKKTTGLKVWEQMIDQFDKPVTVKIPWEKLEAGGEYTIEAHGVDVNNAPLVDEQGNPPSKLLKHEPAAQQVIGDWTLNRDNNEFEVPITMANPQQVGEITVILKDANGEVVWDHQFPPRPEQTVRVPANGLAPGEEFTIEVKAIDVNGTELKNADGKTPWSSKPGKYEPRERTPLNFEFAQAPPFIQQTNALSITLSQFTREKGAEVHYEVAVTENNRPVLPAPLSGVFNGTEIMVPLPAAEVEKLRASSQPVEYVVTLTLKDQITNQPVTKDKATRIVLPEPPGLFMLIIAALFSPWTLGGMLLIGLIAGGIYVAHSRSQREEDVILPAPGGLFNPPTDMDRRVAPEGSLAGVFGTDTEMADDLMQPQVTINFVSTPEPWHNQGQTVKRFPLVIGRENVPFLVKGDTKISRRHAEILLDGNTLLVKDLHSANGTAFVVSDTHGASGTYKVTRQLDPGVEVPWDGTSLLRLGKNTVIELVPEGSIQPPAQATEIGDAAATTVMGPDLVGSGDPSRSLIMKEKLSGTPLTLQPKIRLEVIETPNHGQNPSGLIESFPCVIGRENATFLIPGDGQISRQHAEINVKSSTVVVKDLKSANGSAFVIPDVGGVPGGYTVVAEIPRGGDAPWDGTSLLRLGPNTVIKLSLEGSLKAPAPRTMKHDSSKHPHLTG